MRSILLTCLAFTLSGASWAAAQSGYPTTSYQGTAYPSASYPASDLPASAPSSNYGSSNYGSASYGPASYESASYAPPSYPAAGNFSSYPATNAPGGYPASGYSASSYPASSYPSSGYPSSGYPSSGYPSSGYPSSGYPSSGYPASDYPTSDYPASNYPSSDYPSPSVSYPPPANSGAAPWVRPAGYDEPSVYRNYADNELLPPPEEVPLLPADVAPLPAGVKSTAPAAGSLSSAGDGAAADASPAPPDLTVKSLPLLDPFPQWLQFGDFNAAKLWSGTIQLGLNGAEGNAVTFNIASGYDLKRETKFLILTTDLRYNKSTSRMVETQHNAIFNGKSEWLFQESPWTAFLRTYLEYDEFQAFDLRVVTNAGAGYRLIDRARTKLTTRFGSGFSHEIGGPDGSYVPEAVFGVDFSHHFTPRQKFNLKGDYFPEWGQFENYRVVTTADWELLFDQVANLSLKIGLTDRYDSSPNGVKPNDFIYSTLILYKL